MEFRRILDEFEQLSGLNSSEITNCYSLITLCKKELEQMRKSVELQSEEIQLLEQLAAVNAYYRYLMRQPISATFIKVADVSVQSTETNRLEQVRILRDELLKMAAGLLKDRSFVFEAV